MKRIALLLGLTLLGAAPSDPLLNGIGPIGVQRGNDTVLVLYGRRLADPLELITYRPGITVTKLEAVNPRQVRASVTIAPDAPLGEHQLRLRTRSGLTSLRTIYVGALPVIAEKEPNSDFAQPQKIGMNVTVHGVVATEDVDHYLIEAKKGQRISVEIEAIRLGAMLLDPYVAILDMNRLELAAADDTALLQQDAYVSVLAPADGTYVILVRDSAYGGNNRSRYRLHVGDFPRPSAVYPLGGKGGEKLEITYLGDPAGPIKATVDLPKKLDQISGGTFALPIHAEQNGAIAPSPNWLRVSPFPNVLETEPNNDRTKATATELPLPLAFNGIIEREGDHDWFSFKAAQNQTMEIRAFARRLRTPVDPVLNVFDANGRHLIGNDDQGRSPDSYIRYRFPAAGLYHVRVRDHLNRGGPDFAYRVEITPARPRIYMNIPHVRRYDSQSRQWAAVPRGNRWMVLLRTTRMDLGGQLKLLCDGLPEGVTMHAPPMRPNTGVVPVIFEAAPDAPIGGALTRLHAKHPDERVNVESFFYQSVELVQGNPNRTPYYTTVVTRFPVAVTEEAPFSVRIVEPKVPLLRFGTMRLKVMAERKKGFDAPIALQLPFRPPGVGAGYQVVMPRGKTEVHYTINANGRAAVGTWEIAMTASAVVGGGRLYVATPLANLQVALPLVTGRVQLAVTERGQPASLICRLNQTSPFEETGELTLIGLPPGCTTQPQPITKAMKEVIFPVTTDAARSPIGRHRGLFCRLTVTRNGEVMTQNLGYGGVLRIDAPKPAKVAAKPAPKKPPAPRRLTRLEQLRKEAQERLKEGGEDK